MGTEHGQSAFAEKVAVTTDIQIGWHDPVGNDHVESMDGQFSEQRCQTYFATNQPHRLSEFECRLDKSVGDRLLDVIRNSNVKWQGHFCTLVMQHVDQFIANGEYLLCIAQDFPPS